MTATLALLLALGGTSYAAGSMTGAGLDRTAAVGCPAATVRAISICVEKELSGPQNWAGAVETCLIRHRRLPTPAEAFGTYGWRGTATGTTWTSTAYRLPESSHVGQNEQGTLVFEFRNAPQAGVQIGAAGLATPKTFRCVTEPGAD